MAGELSETVETLAERFRSGDVRALARAISLVEKRDPLARGLQHALKDRARAYVVGFTGAPGTGKSTLVDVLVTRSTPRSSSAAWARAGISAACRSPRARRSGCSAPSGSIP